MTFDLQTVALVPQSLSIFCEKRKYFLFIKSTVSPAFAIDPLLGLQKARFGPKIVPPLAGGWNGLGVLFSTFSLIKSFHPAHAGVGVERSRGFSNWRPVTTFLAAAHDSVTELDPSATLILALFGSYYNVSFMGRPSCSLWGFISSLIAFSLV